MKGESLPRPGSNYSIENLFDKLVLLTAVFITRIINFFTQSSRLHNARFARLDEMDRLLEVIPSGID